MKKPSNKINQLFTTNKVTVPLEESICKINISGYSLDNYKTFNPKGYTMLYHLGEVSGGFNYFTKSSKIVLDTGQYSRLMNNFEQLVPNIVKDFGITQQAAIEKSIDFFRIHKLLFNRQGYKENFTN